MVEVERSGAVVLLDVIEKLLLDFSEEEHEAPVTFPGSCVQEDKGPPCSKSETSSCDELEAVSMVSFDDFRRGDDC